VTTANLQIVPIQAFWSTSPHPRVHDTVVSAHAGEGCDVFVLRI
jgi:hypothetical protein